jgi:outer membrane protein OmpA-like peptidoglycan-associated protein
LIQGFTDVRGGSLYNIRLAERRAKEVARYLEQLEIDPARMSIRGSGEKKRECLKKDGVCHQQNRRVFIFKK